MISRDDVLSGYRLILGRAPESEAVIDYHRRHVDLMTFRRVLLQSEEFQALFPSTGYTAHSDFVQWSDVSEPKTVFLHSPKTAGSSLHGVLKSYFSEDRICPERFNRLKNLSAGELCRYRFYSGHFDLVSCRLIPGKTRIVTVLREPTARLVSLYNFLRAHKADIVERNDWAIARLAAALSIEDFYANPQVRQHPYLNNGMARMLAGTLSVEVWTAAYAGRDLLPEVCADQAIESLQQLAAFGIQERFDESVRHILSVLGMPQPAAIARLMVLEEIMSTPGHYRKIEPVSTSQALQAVVHDLVTADSTLYKQAAKVLDSRLVTGVDP